MVSLPPQATVALREHREVQKREWAVLGSTVMAEDRVFSRPDGSLLMPSSVSHAFLNINIAMPSNTSRFDQLQLWAKEGKLATILATFWVEQSGQRSIPRNEMISNHVRERTA